MTEMKEYYYCKGEKEIYERVDEDTYNVYPRNPVNSCCPECNGLWESDFYPEGDEFTDEEYEKYCPQCRKLNIRDGYCPYEIDQAGYCAGDINWQLDEDYEECGRKGQYPLYVGWLENLGQCRKNLTKHHM